MGLSPLMIQSLPWTDPSPAQVDHVERSLFYTQGFNLVPNGSGAERRRRG
jgi:hypothetical protein